MVKACRIRIKGSGLEAVRLDPPEDRKSERGQSPPSYEHFSTTTAVNCCCY